MPACRYTLIVMLEGSLSRSGQRDGEGKVLVFADDCTLLIQTAVSQFADWGILNSFK
jgi:hypothetical protein